MSIPRMGWRRALVAVLMASVSPVPRPVLAHETGTVRLSSSQTPVGGTLTLTGSKFGKDTPLTLHLRGAIATHALGAVRTDATGAFTLEIVLPPDAKAGAYSLVAIAEDGDVVARTALMVVAGGPPAPDPHAMMGSMPGMSEGHGTPEMMTLPGGFGSSRTLAILGLLGICVIAGALIVQRARVAEGHTGNTGMRWGLAAGLSVLATAGVFAQQRAAKEGSVAAAPAMPGMPDMDHGTVAANPGPEHAGMPGMAPAPTTRPARPAASSATMDHASMPGMSVPARAPAARTSAMDPAMPGMDHAPASAPARTQTDSIATDKLRALAALLVSDPAVRARIEADGDLSRRWQDEGVKAAVLERPE